MKSIPYGRLFLSVLLAAAFCVADDPKAPASFLGGLSKIKTESAVPANGDVNPYGVAVVPVSSGKLQQFQQFHESARDWHYHC